MIYKLSEPIREPFWSAGRKFGWDGAGVGLSKNHFSKITDEDELEFGVEKVKKIYRIRKSKAMALYERYKSDYVARGTKLMVLPINELDVVSEEPHETKTLDFGIKRACQRCGQQAQTDTILCLFCKQIGGEQKHIWCDKCFAKGHL